MNRQLKITNIALGITILALIVGSLIAKQLDFPAPVDKHSQSHNSQSGNSKLSTLTGDAFDAAYINEMSSHHAGAVVMAGLVDTESANPAIQTLAQNIIQTQSKELNDLKTWADDWGYSFKVPTQAAIDEMTASMKGKTGEALEKAFLADMIGHHESAIDMAGLAATNAKHQEIKTLSLAVQSAQSAEIRTIREIAETAGYTLEKSSNTHGGGH